MDAAFLRQLAAALESARHEIELARLQSTEPQWLRMRTWRAGVQAANVVAAAVDAGVHELWPPGWWTLWALRKPDDPTRPPAQINIGGRESLLRTVSYGSGCNPDGSLCDDTALALWVQSIYPCLIAKRKTPLKARAGAFNIETCKTDESGRPVGSDGNTLTAEPIIDPETGAVKGEQLSGRIATDQDDFSAGDMLEYLRCQAADWTDAIEIARQMILAAAEIADLTPTDARNKWCYEEWQRGQTLKQIWVGMKQHPEWDQVSDEKAVRKCIAAWAKKHNLPIRKGQQGKPARPK